MVKYRAITLFKENPLKKTAGFYTGCLNLILLCVA